MSQHLIMRVFIKKWVERAQTVGQFKSWLFELLAVWSWVSYLPSLNHFLVCKLEFIW